jgi:SAM-dependent methyltransferase
MIPVVERSPEERDQLKRTFETVAQTYQDVRPEYPNALFDDLTTLADLTPASRLVEFGPGPGKATFPLARRGLSITCVELGQDLAATAAANLASFPRVEVVQGAFETWMPPGGRRFDLVFAATAWHWFDPQIRLSKARDLLVDGGHLAYWGAWHVFPDGGDPLFHQIQPLYEEIDAELHPDRHGEQVWHRPGEIPDNKEEIEASGLFEDVVVRQYDWETSYDAEGYIALISTFSSHIVMPASHRSRLFGEIRRRVAERPDGLVRRHWGAVLHVARRN